MITAHCLLMCPTHKLESVELKCTGTTPTESDFSLNLDELEWLLLKILTKGKQCFQLQSVAQGPKTTRREMSLGYISVLKRAVTAAVGKSEDNKELAVASRVLDWRACMKHTSHIHSHLTHQRQHRVGEKWLPCESMKNVARDSNSQPWLETKPFTVNEAVLGNRVLKDLRNNKYSAFFFFHK